MTDATDATFAAEVLTAPTPVVVDFWAPWCASCERVRPVLEELVAARAGSVSLVHVDGDANPLTAARYAVLTLPTAILFAGGEARSTVRGARARDHYEHAWRDWLR